MSHYRALNGRLFVVLVSAFLAAVLFCVGLPYQLSQMA